MKARLEKGYYVWNNPPRGYRYEARRGEGKVLVRDEPLASIVQEALEGFASGRFDSQAEVKRFLESRPAYPKDLPGGKIRFQRITDLLGRVSYAGYVEAPNGDVSLRKGRHEGLISLATYRRIQERLKGTPKAPCRTDLNEDFPLRGFMLCGECDQPLTACWSKSRTGKKHPYYLCFNRACSAHRKSIKCEAVEGAFEQVLKSLTPSQKLFDLVEVMFRSAWDQRAEQAKAQVLTIKSELKSVITQVDRLMDRIVGADSPTVIAAYEKKIDALEMEKKILVEKSKSAGQPQHAFEEMFELALGFLANSGKLAA
ncbi:MAG: zinc ribbon domain-containing protein [Pseudomonadota bacterium]